MDPKLRLKCYNPNIDLELELDPEFTPPTLSKVDIDGTGAGDGVDPKLRLRHHNPNMDLQLDLDMELTPPKLTSLWYSYGDKTLDGSSCKNL